MRTFVRVMVLIVIFVGSVMAVYGMFGIKGDLSGDAVPVSLLLGGVVAMTFAGLAWVLVRGE